MLAEETFFNMSEVNQQLIAERLNISRATVSRCFTNHPGINPTTRARVFQVATELGYTHLEKRTGKGRAGGGRAKRKNETFGVLICSDEEEYQRTDYQNPSEQILSGVTEMAHLRGTRMDIHLVDPKAGDPADPAYLKVQQMRRRWRGILLVYPFPDAVLEPLASALPTVSLVEQFDHAGLDCVDVDHYKGISAAIEHLVGQGHKRIGYLTRLYQVDASWSFRRYAAFLEKMARLRLPVDHGDVVNVFPGKMLGVEETAAYAAERTRAGVTAWVCAADHQAYDLIRGLKARGLSVPGDVSVTGFDGIETPGDCPDLATVQIPFREIGTTGTKRLFEKIGKRFSSAQHVLIDCTYRTGETVAPPRG
ncbi:LacI family DNA-binding transcriptional regulator [Haloferula sargassicola]